MAFDLPSELHVIIVSHIPHSDIDSLRACARVSRRWSTLAQQRLFSAVIIDSPFVLPLFQKVMRRSPHLGLYARTVYLGLNPNAYFASSNPNAAAMDEVAVEDRIPYALHTLADLLPNVEYICLHPLFGARISLPDPSVPVRDERVNRFTMLHGFSHARELELENMVFSSLDAFIGWLPKSKEITTMALRNCGIRGPPNYGGSRPECERRLTSLVHLDMGYSAALFSAFMRLSPGLVNLRVLSFMAWADSTTDMALITDFLAAVSPKLEHLRVSANFAYDKGMYALSALQHAFTFRHIGPVHFPT
jgi:hypothetical protein